MSETSQASQETSNLEATPAQETAVDQTTTSQPASTSEPTKATTTDQESWEYNGDRNAVPDSFKKYVAGLDRYVSKKDQARAELERKVKEYETERSQRKETPQADNTGIPTSQEPTVTQEEAEAIMLGDAKTLQKVIQREAKHLIEAGVNPKEAVISEKLSALEMRQKEIDAAEVIKSFTEVNPDFSELLKSPVGSFMVEAARKGMDIESIYKQAKEVEAHFISAADAKRKADIEKKKNGSVVGKPVAGNPDTLYAEDENHAKRLAIELSLKGDPRRVQVKDRKR